LKRIAYQFYRFRFIFLPLLLITFILFRSDLTYAGNADNFIFTGSATSSYTIEVPHGRKGVAPQLTLSYNSMGAIKKRLDIVYFGNIVPATNLMTINDMYNHNILNTIHQYQNSILDTQTAKSRITDAKEVIFDSWHEYASKYHTAKEKEINDYAQKRIDESAKTIDTLIYFFEKDDKEAIEKIVKKELYPKINPVIEIIDKLTAYEFSLAAHEKRIANDTYTNTTKILLLALLIIFISAAIIFFPIMANIQQNDTKLRELNDKLATISITDPLTNIYNRRFFELIFPQEIRRTRRKKESICFAMIDIDHFKLYNDHYGHQAGDEALKSVALAMKSNLKRSSDYLFRLGGEEFGIAVSDMKEEDARLFFENVRKSVKELGIEHIKNPAEVMTISIGVTFLESDGAMDMQDIIKKADDSLYEAKESGRDRVVFKKS